MQQYAFITTKHEGHYVILASCLSSEKQTKPPYFSEKHEHSITNLILDKSCRMGGAIAFKAEAFPSNFTFSIYQRKSETLGKNQRICPISS